MTITRLQDKCPECNKIAKELMSSEVINAKGNTIHTTILECYHCIVKTIPKATPFHEFTTFEHKNNGCPHKWNKNHCPTCDAYRLFDFQIEGAEFIEKALQIQKGAGVFDEMGLGKTIQSIAYLNYHPESLPVLFIVKASVLFQFFKEILRWLGPTYLPQIIKTSRDPIIKGLKCYIVSYDLLRRFDREEFVNAGIKTIILDECQQIKNPQSARTKEVRLLTAQVNHIIPLSGTPWKNRGGEFYPVLNMLNSIKFPSEQGFRDSWVDYYFNGVRAKEGGIRNPRKFREFVSDMIIRRERTEVMSELPIISRNMHFMELDKVAQRTYDAEVSEFIRLYNKGLFDDYFASKFSANNMLAALARMRHITGLAKIPATVDFVTEHINETGRKIVIFVHHKDVGVILTREFIKIFKDQKDVKILELTADLSPGNRFTMQEEFNSLDKCIMIASTLTAGEGLNLQSCCDCILHERQWNPANEEQAEGRFIRIGQTSKSVNGTYITAAGTVDEHLSNIVEGKRAAFHAAMNNGETPTWVEGDIMKELASRIVNDASNLQRMASF